MFGTSGRATGTFHSPRQTEREREEETRGAPTPTSISPPPPLSRPCPSPPLPVPSLLRSFSNNVCLHGSALVPAGCFYSRPQTGWQSKHTSRCSGRKLESLRCQQTVAECCFLFHRLVCLPSSLGEMARESFGDSFSLHVALLLGPNYLSKVHRHQSHGG